MSRLAGEQRDDDVENRIGRAEHLDGEERAADRADERCAPRPRANRPTALCPRKTPGHRACRRWRRSRDGARIASSGYVCVTSIQLLLDGEAGDEDGEVEVQARRATRGRGRCPEFGEFPWRRKCACRRVYKRKLGPARPRFPRRPDWSARRCLRSRSSRCRRRCSQRGGVRAMPTPCGVPVRMTVPGSSVVLPLRNSMSVGTSKIMSAVVQSWSVSPLTMVRMRSALRVGNFVARHEARAERGEGVEGSCRGTTARRRLPSASRARSRHSRRCSRARSRARRRAGRSCSGRADDDGELAFVIDLRAGHPAREHDRVAGVLHGGRVLHEEHGILRQRRVRFGGVLAVVQADAEDARGTSGASSRATCAGSSVSSGVAKRSPRKWVAEPSACRRA